MDGDLYLLFSSVWGGISSILLIAAVVAAMRGNIQLHKKLMIFLTVAAWTFVVVYVVRFVSGIRPDIPEELIPWFAIHGITGFILLAGVTTLIRTRLKEVKTGEQGHFVTNHKFYGRLFVIIWLFMHVGGAYNYFVLHQ